MKTLHRRCAGLDVRKKEVVACLRLVVRGKANYEVGRFLTTTRGLLELAEWLEQAGCTHVAMGGDGRLLEAGLAHAGRALPTDPGQRGAYQGCTQAQERHERCDLDR